MTQNPEESPIHGSVQHLNPETLHKNPAFTQVITVTGPARTIYIGGQDAVDAQGGQYRRERRPRRSDAPGPLKRAHCPRCRFRQAGAYHQMERLPGTGTILAGGLYGLPAVLGRSAKPTYH